MNYNMMKAVAGVTGSQKGLLLLEVFRLAGLAGRPLRLWEMEEVMPQGAGRSGFEWLLGSLAGDGLVENYVVPAERNARVYVLTAKGRELLGVEKATPLPDTAKGGEWTAKEDAVLGLSRDEVTADLLGRTVAAVSARRRRLKIPQFEGKRAGRWKGEKPGEYVFR